MAMSSSHAIAPYWSIRTLSKLAQLVPSLEDTFTCQMGQVNLTGFAIVVLYPDSVSGAAALLQWVRAILFLRYCDLAEIQLFDKVLKTANQGAESTVDSGRRSFLSCTSRPVACWGVGNRAEPNELGIPTRGRLRSAIAMLQQPFANLTCLTRIETAIV